MKKIFAGVSLILCLIWFFYFRPLALGGPATYIIVSGVSMEPTFHSGDLVILHRQAEYQIGDVVAYTVKGAGNVIHRIVGGDRNGYITRGDNKNGADPWTPAAEQVLGRQFLHLPKAGLVILQLRQPHYLAALVLLAGLSVWEDDHPRSRRRDCRRKAMTTAQNDPRAIPRTKEAARPAVEALAPPNWAGPLLYLALLLAALALALGFFAFRAPLAVSEEQEVLKLEHQMRFDYTVRTARSELYPQGQVVPAGGESQSVFTRLVDSILVTYSYQLAGLQAGDLTVELTPTLRVLSGDQVLHTRPLGDPLVYQGDELTGQVELDLDEIQAWVAGLEELAGYSLNSYVLEVVPEVRVQGSAAGQEASGDFAPAFSLRVNQTQITLDGELERAESRSVTQTATRANRLSLAGLSMPVQQARSLSLWGGIPALVIAAVCAGMLYLGWGLSQTGKLLARYRGKVVTVTAVEDAAGPVIHVAGMAELARLAEKEGALILHQAQGDGRHLFFLPAGVATYVYSPGDGEEA